MRTLMALSDKLKHYSKMLNKKSDENSKELANNFEHLSNNLQNTGFANLGVICYIGLDSHQFCITERNANSVLSTHF